MNSSTCQNEGNHSVHCISVLCCPSRFMQSVRKRKREETRGNKEKSKQASKRTRRMGNSSVFNLTKGLMS